MTRLRPCSVTCRICGESKNYISSTLSFCAKCIKERPNEAHPYIVQAHEAARSRHGLPAAPPKTDGGVGCRLCSNQCSMGEGETGYCGLRWNSGGLRSRASPSMGLLYTYLDPHVTNCCSAWFCPGGTGAGYPKYSNIDGPEIGFYNLSVFLYGCNFDCLFCQNPNHKEFGQEPTTDIEAFVRRITGDPRISCVCFFGGSPEPQLPFAIKASKMALEAVSDRPLRICFEMNGCGDTSLAMRAADLALESGGSIKFDLKCFSPDLSRALSGVENKQAYRNFKLIAEARCSKRWELPFLSATTLLVPGYVDAAEVEAIAKFIADLAPNIPYGLLVFHPAHMMRDLPTTPLEQVMECYRAARKYLTRVNVGNLHLLGFGSMRQFAIDASRP